MSGAGLAADLGTLLSRLPPSPPDVELVTSNGAVVAGEAHRGLLWVRVPALRGQLRSDDDDQASASDSRAAIQLPEGIGTITARLVLHWVYRGELPRQED